MNPYPIHLVLWYSDVSQRDLARDAILSALRAAGVEKFLVLAFDPAPGGLHRESAFYLIPFALTEEASRDHRRRYDAREEDPEVNPDLVPSFEICFADCLFQDIFDHLKGRGGSIHIDSGAGSFLELRNMIVLGEWVCVDVHREGAFPPKFIQSDRDLLRRVYSRTSDIW